MALTQKLPSLGLLIWLCSSLPALSIDDASFGLLYHRFPLTLAPGERTEAFGPFFYCQKEEESKTWAVPPVLSHADNDDLDFEHFDFFWKVSTYDRFGQEYRWQLLQLLSFAGGGTQSDTNVHRFSLFPVYFQQRSQIPEKNYTAVVPFYGTLKGRLFRDEIKFVLFPLYGQTRKKDVVTDNFLFPILHLRQGEGLHGWQVWPLFGSEHKEITTRTNHWGDSEVVGGHDKHFALWPLYFNQHTGIGTDQEARQQALLPFWTSLRSAQRDSTTYLWPLGFTHTEDHEKRYEEWGAPWPLVVFARGEGKTTDRIWPFFSQSHNTNLVSNWYLWPAYKFNKLKADPFERERTRILLFLYSDVRAKNTEAGTRRRQIDLWPLFTVRRDFEGKSRVQLLSLVEPILPNNTGVERNLSPLWSIWRSEGNAKTGATSQSFLWNLYRRDATPETRKTSFLFGLFQRRSSPEGKHWRVLFIPVGKTKQALPSGR